MADSMKIVLFMAFIGVWFILFVSKIVRPLFMSNDKFQVYLDKRTKLTRKLLPKYKPSLLLNRIVHLIGFVLGLVVFGFVVFIFVNSL